MSQQGTPRGGGASTERSPLLKTSNSRYSQSSSREEARPLVDIVAGGGGTVGNVLLAGSPPSLHDGSAASPFGGPSSYQRGETPTTRTSAEEDHATPFQRFHGGPTSDGGDEDEDSPLLNKGPMVVCRVCDAEIPLEGKTNQHVVRCQQCNEVTPIRAAPPGKKYVRCPCNCLLVCKASSTRIACPRQDCRRVITLAASSPVGTAVRAPAGTCRVQCVHCLEIFMFNALSNSVANCPHCKKISSVGVRFARSRATMFCIASVISLLLLTGLFIAVFNSSEIGVLRCTLLLVSIALSGYCLFRLVFYARMKISQVLGPI